MDQAKLRDIEAHCTQEAMPLCQAHCPLRMDVRAFMAHMSKGNVREARKVLERHLPLPEIMARICDHPCEEACLRQKLGGALAVGALEASCIAAAEPQTKSFPRPPKAKRVAVLGNTLAGLTVAFELGRKAWPVIVFYEDDTIILLKERFEQLSAENIQKELDGLLKTGCTFTRQALTEELFHKACADFDAVFVDGDAAVNIRNQLGKADKNTLLVQDNCCAVDVANGTPSASTQAGDARRAATTLERLLTGVSIVAGREEELTRTSPLFTPLQGIEAQERIVPLKASYTTEEAISEAQRCLLCECKACVKECVYMQKYGGYPRSYARQIYNNASIVKGEHLANKLVNGCTLCGQCTEICPENFSMAELCLQARQDMVSRNYMPPSAHEFALEDMESANADALFMGDSAKSEGKCSYLFFPGCQLAASRGEQVLAVYEILRSCLGAEQGVGLALGCCGIPAHWAGEQKLFAETLTTFKKQWECLGKPICVLACSSCMQVFTEHSKDIPVVSLWEILDKNYAFPLVNKSSVYTIHDPCTARHNKDWQHAVRSLAIKCGVDVQEPLHTGTTTPCCGYGGLVWAAQPDLAADICQKRGEEMEHTGLTSCIMCREKLVQSGKPSLYLLDLLPLGAELAHSPETPAFGLSARRAQRFRLRQEVLHTYAGQDLSAKQYQVIISKDLLELLEKRHILRDDVEETIAFVENSKKRFLEKVTGHYTGSWKPRNVTFWVTYSVESTGYVLHDAWCHRMVVPNTNTKDGASTSPSRRIRA